MLVWYRISSFQFRITEGCLPFSYVVAVIELGTHSWGTCSFSLIRKTLLCFSKTANEQYTVSHPQLLTIQIYMTKFVFNIPAVMTAATGFASPFKSKAPCVSLAEKSSKVFLSCTRSLQFQTKVQAHLFVRVFVSRDLCIIKLKQVTLHSSCETLNFQV